MSSTKKYSGHFNAKGLKGNPVFKRGGRDLGDGYSIQINHALDQVEFTAPKPSDPTKRVTAKFSLTALEQRIHDIETKGFDVLAEKLNETYDILHKTIENRKNAANEKQKNAAKPAKQGM